VNVPPTIGSVQFPVRASFILVNIEAAHEQDREGTTEAVTALRRLVREKVELAMKPVGIAVEVGCITASWFACRARTSGILVDVFGDHLPAHSLRTWQIKFKARLGPLVRSHQHCSRNVVPALIAGKEVRKKIVVVGQPCRRPLVKERQPLSVMAVLICESGSFECPLRCLIFGMTP